MYKYKYPIHLFAYISVFLFIVFAPLRIHSQNIPQGGNLAPLEQQNALRYEIMQQQQQQQEQQANAYYHPTQSDSGLYENDYYVGPYNDNGPWGPNQGFDNGDPSSELYMPQ